MPNTKIRTKWIHYIYCSSPVSYLCSSISSSWVLPDCTWSGWTGDMKCHDGWLSDHGRISHTISHADASGLPGSRRCCGSRFQHSGLSPCFSLISIGIYNIEATHANRRKMSIVCASIYAAILAAFCIGFIQSGNFHIGSWIYVMIVLFAFSVAYCIYMIIVEIRKRRRMLEVMAGYDILPYVRYARASVFIVFFLQ